MNRERDQLRKERDEIWQSQRKDLNDYERMMVETAKNSLDKERNDLMEKRKEMKQMASFNLEAFSQQIRHKK